MDDRATRITAIKIIGPIRVESIGKVPPHQTLRTAKARTRMPPAGSFWCMWKPRIMLVVDMKDIAIEIKAIGVIEPSGGGREMETGSVRVHIFTHYAVVLTISSELLAQ